MKTFIMAVILAAFSANVYALNSSGCTSLVYGSGWWRKYPGMGVGETGINNMTKTSSKGSSIVGSTDYSSQATTAALDPGVSTKASQSSSQVTSSWGPCSLLASAGEMRQLRDLYYAQNKEDFLRELAQGAGEHLEVMAFFGRCQSSEQKQFNQFMQQKFPTLIQKSQNDKEFMDKFDQYLVQLDCRVG